MPAPEGRSLRESRATAAVRNVLLDTEGLTQPQIDLVERAIAAYAAAFTEPTLAPPPALPMPWRLRLPYAWRALTGRIRPVSDIDTSQLDATGWVEGRVRVQIRRPPRKE